MWARDPWKLGQLHLDDGRWAGRQRLPQASVKRSIAAQARVRDAVDYGYLWWLQPFIVNGRTLASIAMSGMGGNKVCLFPEPDAVVVITTTNYDARGTHPLTEKPLTTRILPALLGN